MNKTYWLNNIIGNVWDCKFFNDGSNPSLAWEHVGKFFCLSINSKIEMLATFCL